VKVLAKYFNTTGRCVAKNKEYKEEFIKVKDKEIFAVYV